MGLEATEVQVARIVERLEALREDVRQVQADIEALRAEVKAALNNGLAGRLREVETGLAHLDGTMKVYLIAVPAVVTFLFNLLLKLIH